MRLWRTEADEWCPQSQHRSQTMDIMGHMNTYESIITLQLILGFSGEVTKPRNVNAIILKWAVGQGIYESFRLVSLKPCPEKFTCQEQCKMTQRKV